jgi:uncharacterized protein (DUF433 family)
MHERIASDPKVMMGKRVIRGTRVTVELIVGKLRRGVTAEQLLEDYLHLTEDDILAAQSYARDKN